MPFLTLLLLGSSGVAISGAQPPVGHLRRPAVAIDCSAFRGNADGSWTSVRSTKVGTVTMSSGGTFLPGVTLNGVDLGAELQARCRRP